MLRFFYTNTHTINVTNIPVTNLIFNFLAISSIVLSITYLFKMVANIHKFSGIFKINSITMATKTC